MFSAMWVASPLCHGRTNGGSILLGANWDRAVSLITHAVNPRSRLARFAKGSCLPYVPMDVWACGCCGADPIMPGCLLILEILSEFYWASVGKGRTVSPGSDTFFLCQIGVLLQICEPGKQLVIFHNHSLLEFGVEGGVQTVPEMIPVQENALARRMIALRDIGCFPAGSAGRNRLRRRRDHSGGIGRPLHQLEKSAIPDGVFHRQCHTGCLHTQRLQDLRSGRSDRSRRPCDHCIFPQCLIIMDPRHAQAVRAGDFFASGKWETGLTKTARPCYTMPVI